MLPGQSVLVSRCAILCLASFASFTVAARADVKPSALFSDHMVLQGGMRVPIWGTAGPGEKVTVTFEKQKKSVYAEATVDGHNPYKTAGLPALPH